MLTPKVLTKAKERMIVLHPLPRIDEIRYYNNTHTDTKLEYLYKGHLGHLGTCALCRHHESSQEIWCVAVYVPLIVLCKFIEHLQPCTP